MILKRPMLAGKLKWSKLQYPCFVQPKLDGIRFLIDKRKIYSRRLKLLPNRNVQAYVAQFASILQGLDGEIVVGDPTAPDVYRKTESGVMTQRGMPDFKLIVFDYWNRPTTPYDLRLVLLRREFGKEGKRREAVGPIIEVIKTKVCRSKKEVLAAYAHFVEQGYEGAIVRSPSAPYKNGRSTPKEGYLLKLKEFVDEEAKVIGFVEQLKNNNPQTLNEIGLHKRSSHKANKTAKGTLGAIEVYSKKYPKSFFVGTGFDDAIRKEIWQNRSRYLGKLVKFRYQPYGMKDVPRVPRFVGFRNPIDL